MGIPLTVGVLPAYLHHAPNREHYCIAQQSALSFESGQFGLGCGSLNAVGGSASLSEINGVAFFN